MTQIVNDTENLTFVLTSYGLSRVAEALNDPNVEIYLSKIKLGDADYYDPTEYVQSNPNTDSLKSPIPGAEFYLVDKELLVDGLTVSLHAIIPETSGGYDIREVGLYETISTDGVSEDKLFALSTQQPFVKPTTEEHYYIAIDYYIFLKSQNFANIYEQIVINPDTGLVTYKDLDQYLKTVLFAQASLMDQISHNSHIIGLDRAGQLSQKIREDQINYGYYSIYESYTSLIDTVDLENIFGFWVFNYPRRASLAPLVSDISGKGNNLVCDQNISLYQREYSGIFPELTFDEGHFYHLPSALNMSLLNYGNTKDADFTMLFCVNPTETKKTRTLLAQVDESIDIKVFEVKEIYDTSGDKPGYRLQVRLYGSEANQYLTFLSEKSEVFVGPHAIILGYQGYDNYILHAFVNGKQILMTGTDTGSYTHMNEGNSPTLYGWTCTPSKDVYASTAIPATGTTLHNMDGSPALSYWQLVNNDSIHYIHGTIDTTATSDGTTTTTDELYAFTAVGGGAIGIHDVYVKSLPITAETTLYNRDYTEYTGTQFSIGLFSGSYTVIDNDYDTPASRYADIDLAPQTLYKYVANFPEAHIWANSDTDPGVFYNYDSATHEYSVYTGTQWRNDEGIVVYSFDGEKYPASYDSSLNVEVPSALIASFIINSQGLKDDLIDSNVSVVSVIKELPSLEDLRKISLIFSSGMGINPCMGDY